MKMYRVRSGIVMIMLFAMIAGSMANTVFASDGPLPKGLTDAERKLLKDDYDGYLRGQYTFQRSQRGGGTMDFSGLERPPVGPMAPSEYDPAEYVCFSWTGYTSLLSQLIRDVSKETKCIVATSSYSVSSAKNRLKSAGANMDNIQFIPTRLDSVWMRDFGPHTIFNQSSDVEILDLVYNRPRPNDDKFPTTVAEKLDLSVHYPRIILPGGNLILDGHGVAIMTDVTFDPAQGGDPNMSIAEMEKIMADYFGCKKVIVLEDLKRDGTGHVDIFVKLLTDRDIVVGEYATPSSGYGNNYDIMNRAAERLAQEKNGKGEYFRVHRIPTPAYRYGVTRTYTNALIVNNQLLVPVYGDSATEEKALAVYRSILPNHDVIPYDCNDIISANGAIHCITKMVMKDPLEISLAGDPETNSRGAKIALKIESTKGLLRDEAPVLFWQVEGDYTWASVELTATDENGVYEAVLPAQAPGTAISCFAQAEDEMGRIETYPNNAPEEGHFTVNF